MQMFPKSMFQKSQVRTVEIGSQGNQNLLVSVINLGEKGRDKSNGFKSTFRVDNGNALEGQSMKISEGINDKYLP